MTDRTELLKRLMAGLGLGTKPQSLIGGELRDGCSADITLEDPYVRLTPDETPMMHWPGDGHASRS